MASISLGPANSSAAASVSVKKDNACPTTRPKHSVTHRLPNDNNNNNNELRMTTANYRYDYHTGDQLVNQKCQIMGNAYLNQNNSAWTDHPYQRVKNYTAADRSYEVSDNRYLIVMVAIVLGYT